MGVLIVAQGMKFLESWDVMHQKSELAACTSILAVVKFRAKMRHLEQESSNAFYVPEKTSARIFNGEKDSTFVTFFAKFLSHIVKLVGSGDPGLQI